MQRFLLFFLRHRHEVVCVARFVAGPLLAIDLLDALQPDLAFPVVFTVAAVIAASSLVPLSGLSGLDVAQESSAR